MLFQRFCLCLFSTVVISACGFGGVEKIDIYLNDNKFMVEVADDSVSWEKGLMYRKNLLDNNGMLFVFPDSIERGFWMKNTLISLDILFFDDQANFVRVYEKVPQCKNDPCRTYDSGKPAKYVLEVKGGTLEKFGIPTDNLKLRFGVGERDTSDVRIGG